MGATRAEREWLEIVADLMADPPGTLPDRRIALQLCSTFALTGCSYNDVADGRHAQRLWPADAPLAGLRTELQQWSESRAHLEHPLLRFYLSTGRRVPLQIADVAPGGLRGRAGELLHAVGAPHQLALPLALGPGRNRSFVLGRVDGFGAAELGLGRLLWRLLTGVDRHVAALARHRADAGLAADLRITPRELAVLGLLTEGLTAAAIARRLTIAERTVQKHLENAYAKLGVADRLSAVLRARHLGLLPEPEPEPEPERRAAVLSV